MQVSTFGERLRRARLDRGWRQVDLHVAAHVNLGDICKIERGRLKASEGQITKLAAALNVPAAALTSSNTKDQAG